MSYYINAWVAHHSLFEKMGVSYTQLNQGFGISRIEPLEPGNQFAYVHGDYSGGIGQQAAVYYNDGKKTIFNEYPPGAINRALVLLGVKRYSDMDEFDSLGLDNKRDNSW